MPRKNGHLTPRERALTENLARFGDPAMAAAASGYAPSSIPVMVQKVKHSPELVAAARKRAEVDITAPGGLVDLATARARAILQDTAPSARAAQVTLIRFLLERYGTTDSAIQSELSQMTLAELDQALAEMLALRREVQRPTIDVTPVGPEAEDVFS